MPPRTLNRDEELRPDLRLGHIHRAKQRMARVSRQFHPQVSVGVSVPVPGTGNRAVVVKTWMAKPQTTGAHLRYLTQGKGTDGTDTTLFNAEGFVRTPQSFTRAAHDDSYQFRWVVSAVDGPCLSLITYIQNLMGQVSRDLRQPLQWMAATHRDTAHVHTHILVRGRDQAGARVVIPRSYLHHGLRYRAMGLATAVLGHVPRKERGHQRASVREILRELSKQRKEDRMDANHPTQLDGDPTPDAPASTPPQVTQQPSLLERLAVLKEALAEQRAQEKTRQLGLGL
jgi:hypothetical protein